MNESSFITNLRNEEIIRSAVSLVLGLILIIWPDAAINTLVYIAGTVLLAAGIFSCAISFKLNRNESGYRSLFSLGGAANILFGILLFAFPGFFVGVMMYLFAIILLVLGISDISSLYRTSKIARIYPAYFILPVLLSIAGIVIIFNPFKTAAAISVFAGISLAAYALFEIFTTWKFQKIKKDFVKGKYGQIHEIEDTDFVEEK